MILRWSPSDPDEPPSMQVVKTVAAYTGHDPGDMPPLGSVLDLDALNALLTSEPPESDHRTLSVSFTYLECEVTIHDDGAINIAIPDSA